MFTKYFSYGNVCRNKNLKVFFFGARGKELHAFIAEEHITHEEAQAC